MLMISHGAYRIGITAAKTFKKLDFWSNRCNNMK